MAYQDQFYTVGTVTVTGGSTTVTGTGTGWETALIVGGVFYAGGGAYPIQSVSSETELTLAIPYVGVNAAGVGYAIDRQRAAAISNIAMNDRLAQIIREISIGNIEELNALDLIANRVLTTNAAGHLSQEALGTFGRALLALATGTSAQYVQGDGTLQTLNSASVGLQNVNNTSDANKPVSTAQQTALNLKLDKAGNTGLSSSYAWSKATSPGITAINLGEPHNEGPTGQGFSRRITHGFTGNLNARTWFEINHGLWHGLTVEVSSNSGAVYFSFRADGSFNAPGPVNGTAKNFEIDHPTDPDNYDLRHCATEAPEMLVEYRGTAQLVNGRVTVDVEDHYGVMPGTFGALWADAWVTSLQNQDGFDRVHPSRLSGSVFEIFCENESSTDLVTWVVMARRNDPYVRWEGCTFTDAEGRLIVEFEKPE